MPAALKIEFAQAQWIGARQRQEDAFAAEVLADGDLLAVVCDGMGGHAGGEMASQAAVNAFVKNFKESKETSVPARLHEAVLAANQAVKVSQELVNADGGTTLVGCYFQGNKLWWVSVGDSLLMHYRQGQLKRLNEDHSMRTLTDVLFERGEITHHEAVWQRSSLRSALIGLPIEMLDLPKTPFILEPKDRVVISSDGVESWMEELWEDMLELTRKDNDDSVEYLAQKIIHEVRAYDDFHQDNVTLIVVNPFAL